MSNVQQADSAEEFLSLLRSSAEAMPTPVRQRIGQRLVGVTLPPPNLAGPLATPTAARFWRTPRFAIALALPVGAVFGVAGFALLSRAKAPAPAPVPVVRVMNPVPSLPSVLPLEARPSAVPVVAPAPRSSAQGAHRVVTAAAPAAPTRGVVAQSPVSDAFASDADLTLLERARSVFSEGDAARTLELLRVHEQRYPGSPFQQERESLGIKALVAVGRSGEAEARAEAFVKRYPQSALRGSVERAVGKKF